jgi:hypothetical protein
MAAKFHSKKTFTRGEVTVEAGFKSSKQWVKITVPSGTGEAVFSAPMARADDLADALDDALDAMESDPLLWE